MVTEEVAWHDRRRARIRKNHPQVRDLYGHDSRTQLAVAGLVGAQFAVARLVSRATLGPWLGATLVVGPTIAHALGVLIHETSHNLVAKGGAANKVWGLVLNLPLGAPAAMEFRHQHLQHHRHLGDAREVEGRDTQAPPQAEDSWVGGSPLRKLLSFTAGRFYWKSRPGNAVPFDAWMTANWITSFGAITLVAVAWGPASTLYLLCSSLLAFGPHSFGARRLSEHFPMHQGQPTNSYYGPLNHLSFDVGYHVEHHDFPNVAWSRMRKLHELAQEEYEPLFAFRSWTRLLLRYLLDERYRVGHYVGMSEPLKGPIEATESGTAESGNDQDTSFKRGPDAPTTVPRSSGFFTRSGRRVRATAMGDAPVPIHGRVLGDR